jgi:hypothetical protein
MCRRQPKQKSTALLNEFDSVADEESDQQPAPSAESSADLKLLVQGVIYRKLVFVHRPHPVVVLPDEE